MNFILLTSISRKTQEFYKKHSSIIIRSYTKDIFTLFEEKSNPGTRRVDLYQHGYQLLAGTRRERRIAPGIGIHAYRQELRT